METDTLQQQHNKALQPTAYSPLRSLSAAAELGRCVDARSLAACDTINLMEHRRVLAENKHYQVSHEFEVVFLLRKAGLFATSKPEIVIGDFYGDPAAAVIDEKERFVIMVGCGMIIYNLSEPFEPYQYNQRSNQWAELFRNLPTKRPLANYWSIESITQTGDNTFHFTVDPNSNEAGTYEIMLPNLAIQKVQ